MKQSFRDVKGGGVASARGFLVAGVVSGIKNNGKKDVALVYSSCPAEVGAVFTTNQIKAAPVRVSMQHARNGSVRGVILNSGNANACTGLVGLQNAMEMTERAAREAGCKAKEFLVCSTGRIGVPLPMSKVRAGIVAATKQLGKDGLAAAHAIMTSDTVPKHAAVRLLVDGKIVTIGGMAKGAGMIHPNMATMLCVITTDALIDKRTLQRCVHESVETSFNRISIDGDTSTNDTVLVLANGQAQNNVLKSYHVALSRFQQALTHLMRKLAAMIVEDGEGISRVVEVCVKGAATGADAKAAALAVGRSPLVKTSWCGGDPNWGRLMDAIGYSPARVREEIVDIFYDGILAVSNGKASRTPVAKLRRVTAKRRFTITINLNLGRGEYTLLTTDLTEKYVTFNKGE